MIVNVLCKRQLITVFAVVGARLVIEAKINIQGNAVDCLLVFKLIVARNKVIIEVVDGDRDVENHVYALNTLTVWWNREMNIIVACRIDERLNSRNQCYS